MPHLATGRTAGGTAGTPAVATRGLAKRFGAHHALDGIDLDVAPGQVFGYLGPNGSGKTTTIRLLLGLSRPTSGEARVLGRDARTDRVEIHRRVGYVPGDFRAPGRTTAEEYLRFLARLRGGVDPGAVHDLADRLGLDLGRRIGTLSRGNRQKVALVQALAHRPELLVLDEPTTGLDPLVHREVLEILREVRAEGRTVLLSSHVLSEVEAVADTVGILREGRLVVVESVEGLKDRAVRRLDLTFGGPPPTSALRAAVGVREVSVDGRVAHVRHDGSAADLLRVAAPYGVDRVTDHEADLEEVFLSFYARDPVGAP